MNRKQKRMLARILVSAALLAALHFVPAEGWVRLALYLAPYLIIGYDVLRRAVLGVVHGEVFDENFLMAVATVGALALGEYGESVEVMVFYQLGELFQSYAVGKSRRSIAALMDIRPDSANLEKDGAVVTVSPEEVQPGQIIVVRPGEKVPLDGRVVEGASALNTSALTGESLPRDVAVGDEVVSGCVNTTGLLRVEVTKPFGQSTVSRILDLVENSSMKKAKAENFITRFARWYTPAVCIGALALAVLPPLFLGDWGEWLRRALTFLVISCPCALVISVPLAFFGGIGGASRAGILVKGGNYLEALASTRTVVFDKTGTLTQGVFEVARVLPAAWGYHRNGCDRFLPATRNAEELADLDALGAEFGPTPLVISSLATAEDTSALINIVAKFCVSRENFHQKYEAAIMDMIQCAFIRSEKEVVDGYILSDGEIVERLQSLSHMKKIDYWQIVGSVWAASTMSRPILERYGQNVPLLARQILIPVLAVGLCYGIETDVVQMVAQYIIRLLTARGELSDRVRGLDQGADYYLTKPFQTPELLACVRLLLRRSNGESGGDDRIHRGDLVLDPGTFQVTCGQRSARLSRKEYDLLEMLMRNGGQILSKEQLLLKAWGYESNAEDNNVEVYISFLRRKLELVRSNMRIRTVRLVGYCLEEKE